MGQFDDLLAAAAFNQDPYPLYHQLRNEAPVYWSDAWGCWMLTRYDDITWTLQDYQTFTSLGRLTATMDLPEPLWEKVEPLVRHYSSGAYQCRSNRPHKNAQIGAHGLFPRAPSENADLYQDIVDHLIDERIERGCMDVIWDFHIRCQSP